MEVKGDPTHSPAKKPQDTVLARALYDNNSEYSQELGFVKGDVLTVLKKDPEGYEGWWICSLRGKVGIAPGNRLEILGTITPKHTASEPEPYDQIPTPTTNDSSHTERDENSFPRPPITCYENVSHSQSTRNGYLPQSSQDHRSHSPSLPVSLDGNADLEAPSLKGDSTLDKLKQLTVSDPSKNHQSADHQAAVLEIDDIPQRRTGAKAGSHGNATGKPTVRFAEPYYVNCDTPTNGGLSSGTRVPATQAQLQLPGPERTDQSALKPRPGPHGSEPTRMPYTGPIPPPRLDTLSPDWIPQAGTGPWNAASGGGGSSGEDLLSYCSLGSVQSSSSSSTAITTGSSARFSTDTRSQWGQIQGHIETLISDLTALLDRERRGCVPTQAGVQRIKQLVNDLVCEVTLLRELIDTAREVAFRQRSTQLQHLLHRYRCDLQKEEESLNLTLFQLQGNDLQTKVSEQVTLEAVGASVRSLSTLLSALTVSSHSFLGLLSASSASSPSAGEDGGAARAAVAKEGDAELLIGVTLKEADSADDITPPATGDLASLLQVYAAQMQSHNLLVRDTVEEFLGFLRTRTARDKTMGQRAPLPTAGVVIAHAKFLLRCASQLVNLAASLSAALKDVAPDAVADGRPSAVNAERLQASIESAGDAVCEALKGLIAQTKEVAGYLSAPSLDLPQPAKCSGRPIISGPELERLVGAISRVASTTSDLKQLVVSVSNTASENRSSSSTNS
uniref:Breast cancer anti-estrogen resistance protein 1 n=1 Tax=Schistocephalus solidus TaxID=70667 RepID=A0A0X3P512_SCHSO